MEAEHSRCVVHRCPRIAVGSDPEGVEFPYRPRGAWELIDSVGEIIDAKDAKFPVGDVSCRSSEESVLHPAVCPLPRCHHSARSTAWVSTSVRTGARPAAGEYWPWAIVHACAETAGVPCLPSFCSFTPQLAAWYEQQVSKGPLAGKVDIVFVSSDRKQEEFDEYRREMPWKSFPTMGGKVKAALSSLFKVRTAAETPKPSHRHICISPFRLVRWRASLRLCSLIARATCSRPRAARRSLLNRRASRGRLAPSLASCVEIGRRGWVDPMSRLRGPPQDSAASEFINEVPTAVLFTDKLTDESGELWVVLG